MKDLLILLFTLPFTVGFGQTTDGNLFPIVENNKIGFIDANGRVVIQPIFLNSDEFSGGLASARINGTYGYINKTGNFFIQPQFDYATSFSEGLAIVYKDGQPFFINKHGQIPFEINFPAISWFESGRAKIQTSTNKFGFIDKHGKLIIDTIFTSIRPFIQGMAVVEGVSHYPYPDEEKGIKKNYEVGVIDTLGQFIIPYGKYTEINDFENGYFKVTIPAQPWDTIDGSTEQTGFVDKNRKLVLTRADKDNSWVIGNIYCGLARMSLFQYSFPERAYGDNNIYEGFINLNGEIIINDTNYRYVYDFSDNRAFVQNKDGIFFMINTRGEIISNDTFSDIVGNGFQNGVAFIEKNGKYGLIDTNANFLIQPQFEGIDDIGIMNNCFFFYVRNQDTSSYYDRLYGIATKDGGTLLKATMQDFDRSGFQNGLLKCIVSDKLTYINMEGRIVWQGPESVSSQLTNLNIDFMNRGYFYAYSKPNKKDIGGFGSSHNLSGKISRKNNFPRNSLSITALPEIKDTVYGHYNGITVCITNTCKKKINFNAQDNRLYMKVQAKNSKGQWKDIEYLPTSWCGNSYHTLTLEPKHLWTFVTPVYEGDIKTKLRIELKYIDPTDKSKNFQKKEITIYSNEYEGYINPGQFWRKQQYYPNGIMDPYND